MKTFKMIDPNLIRLYRYFMPYKWRLGFACVFLMGSASMSSITATLLGKMAAEDADTCTILAGEGYSDEDLEALVAKIEEAYDELEVDAQRGEQPLYPIVFSVE